MQPNTVILEQFSLNNENGPAIENLLATTLTTASALTLTAAQIAGGHINRDPNGANRIDTLPTAALLVGFFRNIARQRSVTLPPVFSFDLVIQNDADAAETITLAIGTGGAIAAGHTVTIAQSNSRIFNIQVTVTTLGSEAYVLRNRGGFTT